MLKTWENLCSKFSPEQLINILRRTVPNYRPVHDSLNNFIQEDVFDKADQIGIIELPDAQTIIVGVIYVKGELTARSGKRKQYDIVKRILRHHNHNAGIFAFYDNNGRFRFSLVTATYYGTRQQYSTFRRYTFFVDPDLPNKTFLQQMKRADFSDLSKILEAFSLEAVSDEFYKDFKNSFDDLASSVQGTNDISLKQDLALLFAIRIIFLGFVQKKGWLGNNSKFLQDYWGEYKKSCNNDTFYKEWLEPLFFEALSTPPGHKVSYGHAPFSNKTQDVLQMAPYLNGELFKRKQNIDDHSLWIPDDPISNFFEFLFQYNFTVEENELYDEELELNPEFLGIIFERITNKDQGAVYTPRAEVDFMCRMALVKWLEQTTYIEQKDLYHLFFREAGTGEAYDEYQKQGDFSPNEIRILIERLENVTICDPAAGSGAFEVGMLQVLEQVLDNLYSRNNTPEDLKNSVPSPFERKKTIIAHSLYGVEVKPWAVWINHLRLWLTLFVDMPDNLKYSYEPLLPSLTFKVRTGDSLVQRIGSKTFPVHGHASISKELKRKITQLKQIKHDFFYNKCKNYHLIEHEEQVIFRAILDDEINNLQKHISKLNKPQYKQTTILEEDYEQNELNSIQQTEVERARLEAEIAEIKAQRQSLKDKRPFIWSNEFAEIFFDRGGFDIIIGNPPYLRQEDISDPNGILEPQAYKDALFEMLRIDFPTYFAKSRLQHDSFRTGRKPSGRSDLYTYFYVRSLRLLNHKGVHVFICSNSWLDVNYGTWLQEFFLRQAPLYFVIDNHARRSFARADINTVITVAGAPMGVSINHMVRFVAFKQPFEDVVLSDNLLEIEQATTTHQNERFRVYPITIKELLIEGSESNQYLSQIDISETIAESNTYIGDKWGSKYLRAPDIFFTIMEKGKDNITRLGDIAEVQFGCHTGLNDFFYLKKEIIDYFHIEKEYLEPIIRSPRDVNKSIIHMEDLTTFVFNCSNSMQELKLKKHFGALNYIKWGSKQITRETQQRKKAIPYPEVTSIKNRKPGWWALPQNQVSKSSLLIMYVWDKYAKIVYSSEPVVSDACFHRVFVDGKEEILAAILNTSPFILMALIYGRSNLGQGAMKLEKLDCMRLPIINPEKLSKNVVKNMLYQYSVFSLREISDLFTECGIDPESEDPIAEQEPNPLPDRKELDDIVFDALGLTEEERKEVYRAVCQLVWERISKARSVKQNG